MIATHTQLVDLDRDKGRMQLRVYIFLTLSALAVLIPSARALADDRFIVVRAGVGEATAAEANLSRTLTREGAAHGVPTFPQNEAVDVVHERESVAADASTRDDVDLLARESRNALMSLVRGNRAEAIASVHAALTRAEAALNALNREEETAEDVLNLCLVAVRAHLLARDHDRAIEQARECHRLVPGLVPRETIHGPDVIAAFEEARTRNRSAPHGTLVVNTDPPGCSVYVNGREVADSPAEIPSLPPGQYAVQVECVDGQPGRVHALLLGPAERVLTVRDTFDRALRTEEFLSLAYLQPATELRSRIGDAQSIADILRTPNVALWSPLTADTARLDLIVARRVVASIAFSHTAGALDAATTRQLFESVLARRSVDLRAGRVQPFAMWTPPAAVTGTRAPTQDDATATEPGDLGADVAASRSTLDWVGPMVLGAVGVGLLALDVAALVSIGCVERGLGTSCMRERNIEPVQFTLFAVGGVGALAGAIVWFVLGGRATDRESAPQLSFDGRILSLWGSF